MTDTLRATVSVVNFLKDVNSSKGCFLTECLLSVRHSASQPMKYVMSATELSVKGVQSLRDRRKE